MKQLMRLATVVACLGVSPAYSFAQAADGTVTGTVTNAATSAPLSGVSVTVYNASGASQGSVTTNASGVYTKTGLASGTYFVRTSNSLGYVDELYNDKPCIGTSCPTVTTGTGVSVTAGATTSGIDFALVEGGSISGTVTDAGTGAPIASRVVTIFSPTAVNVGSATTNTSGVYTTTGLPSGTYFAKVTNPGAYVARTWANIPGPFLAATSGTPIIVTQPAATGGIDFQLERGGSITGTVTVAGTGALLAGVTVRAMIPNGFTRAGSAVSNAAGVYTIVGLLAGDYFLATSNTLGYRDEAYDDVACVLCAVTSQAPVTVAGSATTGPIDFALTALPQAPNDACADAITIVATPYAHLVSTVQATGAPDDPMPTCGYAQPSASKNVWYRFVAPSDGILTLHTVGSTYDTVISVHTGACGSFTELPNGCFDDIAPSAGSGPVDSGVLRVPVTSGVTYSIQVASFSGTAGTLFFSADFAPGGFISGLVKSGDGVTPISGAVVEVYDSSGVQVRTATSDATGFYLAGPLAVGTYFAKASNAGAYVDRLYGQRPCTPIAPPAPCNVLAGTPIAVGAGAVTGNVDFLLPAGGRIAGAVTSAAGGSAVSTGVWLLDANGNRLASATSNASTGLYLSPAVEPGTYYAVAIGTAGYASQAYDGTTSCLGLPGCATAPTPITLTAGGTTAGIDFHLSPGGRIGGVVADATTHLPIWWVRVYIADASGAVQATATSAPGGQFTTPDLASGTYFAYTDNSFGYVNQLYGGLACPLGCDVTAGTPITVTAGTITTGIRFDLAKGGRLSGTVVEHGTATPLAGVAVNILDSAGVTVGTAVTDVSGRYLSNQGVAAGTYSVRTDPSNAHAMRLYSGRTCPSGDCPLPGDAVVVSAGQTSAGIDFSLPVCPGPVSLSPATLPAAVAGQAYDLALSGTGGSSPYSFYAPDASRNTLSFRVFGGTAPPEMMAAANALAPNSTLTANGYYPMRTTFTMTFPVAGGVLPPGLALDRATGHVTGTPVRAGQYAFTIGTVDAVGCGATADYRLVVGQLPSITWPSPTRIIVGTPLSATELNAQADVPGVFVYTPAAGAVLPPGVHELSVTFTPSDLGTYVPVTRSVSIEVIGAAGSDFTGDQRSDVLWRHGTGGDVWLWPMNGAVRTSETFVRTVADTNWEIRGLGDLTGDGKADILWRNRTTGAIYLWPMDGSTPLAETYVATVDPAYDIVGTGDFNGDGKADILWRHLANGEVWIWLMDGATPLGQVYVDRVDPAYVIKGVGDLDGDGKADIVWHHLTAGEVWVWLMDGTARRSATWVGTVPDVGYQIQCVTDLTGDGKADILWHHATSGEVWLWRMDGTARLAESWVGTVPDTGYRIVGAGDYSGDGKSDILWHHATLGEVWVWLMDGTTRLSQTCAGSVADVGYQIVKVK